MSKIGVVTWVDGANYGGFLQAFATNAFLKQQGHTVVFLQYGSFFEKAKHLFASFVLFIIRPRVFMSRIKKHKLLKKTLVVKKFGSYEKMRYYAKQFDYCICGSDQIWNISGISKDKFYLLDFVDPNKRIAFAPSISHPCLNERAIKLFKDYLPTFAKLSIREINGYNLINKYTGLEPKLLFDPVFLFDKEGWGSIIGTHENIVSKINKKYILVYMLSDNEKYYQMIKEFAYSLSVDVVQINLKKEVNPVFKVVKCDPFDFVDLIKHAEYVFTDSFHGLSFSLIMNKQFTIFKRFKDDNKSENSRIYNIINRLNIGDRLVSEETIVDNNCLFKKAIDYKSINEIIKEEQAKNIAYLTID